MGTDYFEPLPPEGAFADEQGWMKLPTTAFSSAVGAIHVKGEGADLLIAIDCGPEISNDRVGNVHGGALMTFADIALGVRVADAVQHRQMATVQMQYNFAGGVPVGARLVCRSDLVRRTKTLVFVRGLLEVEGRIVGSADGIYRVFE